ncbi:MAG: TIGR03643 family protein [Myxococcota bacterium]|nr:TIGR03643 family protein [Myxococcota bacterium]
MKKRSNYPETRVKNAEPAQGSVDWIIWAAWADRITFEEIKERTGLSEGEVIKVMRRNLKAQSFRRWRKRVHEKVSIKHRKRFTTRRGEESAWSLEAELEER